MLNFINKSVPVGKFLTRAENKFITFNSVSVREFPNVSRPKTRTGIRQSRMPVLSRDWEEDVPKCSGREIFKIFQGNIGFPGNAIRERRPLFNFYLYAGTGLAIK